MAIMRLGDIGEFKGGISSLKKSQYDKGIRFINYMDIFKNWYLDSNTKLRLYDASIKDKEKYNVKYGDALFTASSETPDEIAISSVWLSNDEAIFNGFSKRYRFNQNILIPKYSSYLFRSSLFRDEAKRFATGYTRYNISQSSLLNIKVNIPSIKVQKQIIDIIAQNETFLLKYIKYLKLDDIEYTKKLAKQIIDIIEPFEKLEKNLNEIIDKLFHLGLLKNKLNKNNQIKIGSICNISSGKTPPTKSKECWSGNISWMNSGAVSNRKIILSNNKTKTISNYALKNNMAKLISGKSMLIGDVDPSKNKISYTEDIFAFSNHILHIDITNIEEIFFSIINNIKKINSIKSGSVITQVSPSKLKNITINDLSNKDIFKYILTHSYNLQLKLEKVRKIKDILIYKLIK